MEETLQTYVNYKLISWTKGNIAFVYQDALYATLLEAPYHNNATMNINI